MIIKPQDQVQGLTEKDLVEEHTRVLKADNPQAPDNLARFNYKEKMYKFDPTVDQTAIALSLEGCAAWVQRHGWRYWPALTHRVRLRAAFSSTSRAMTSSGKRSLKRWRRKLC